MAGEAGLTQPHTWAREPKGRTRRPLSCSCSVRPVPVQASSSEASPAQWGPHHHGMGGSVLSHRPGGPWGAPHPSAGATPCGSVWSCCVAERGHLGVASPPPCNRDKWRSDRKGSLVLALGAGRRVNARVWPQVRETWLPWGTGRHLGARRLTCRCEAGPLVVASFALLPGAPATMLSRRPGG